MAKFNLTKAVDSVFKPIGKALNDIGPVNVVIGLGAVIAAYELGLFNTGKGDVDDTGLDINEDNLKRPRADYQSTADALFNKMNNSPTFLDQTIGWENSDLLNTLKGYNADELKQIYKDFGKRAETLPIPFANNIPIGEKHDLGYYLGKFMTSSGYAEMQKIFAGTGLLGSQTAFNFGGGSIDPNSGSTGTY